MTTDQSIRKKMCDGKKIKTITDILPNSLIERKVGFCLFVVMGEKSKGNVNYMQTKH